MAENKGATTVVRKEGYPPSIYEEIESKFRARLVNQRPPAQPLPQAQAPKASSAMSPQQQASLAFMNADQDYQERVLRNTVRRLQRRYPMATASLCWADGKQITAAVIQPQSVYVVVVGADNKIAPLQIYDAKTQDINKIAPVNDVNKQRLNIANFRYPDQASNYRFVIIQANKELNSSEQQSVVRYVQSGMEHKGSNEEKMTYLNESLKLDSDLSFRGDNPRSITYATHLYLSDSPSGSMDLHVDAGFPDANDACRRDFSEVFGDEIAREEEIVKAQQEQAMVLKTIGGMDEETKKAMTAGCKVAMNAYIAHLESDILSGIDYADSKLEREGVLQLALLYQRENQATRELNHAKAELSGISDDVKYVLEEVKQIYEEHPVVVQDDIDRINALITQLLASQNLSEVEQKYIMASCGQRNATAQKELFVLYVEGYNPKVILDLYSGRCMRTMQQLDAMRKNYAEHSKFWVRMQKLDAMYKVRDRFNAEGLTGVVKALDYDTVSMLKSHNDTHADSFLLAIGHLFLNIWRYLFGSKSEGAGFVDKVKESAQHPPQNYDPVAYLNARTRPM